MRPLFLAALIAVPTLGFSEPVPSPVAAKVEEKAMPDENAPHEHSHEGEAAPQPFGKGEENTDYFWRKSDEAFHAGDYPRAIGLHKAIVAIDPTDTESFGVAAWLMWSLGQKEEALAHIKHGLELNPTDADMWNEAGQHYDLQKKLPEAKEAYFNAVKFSPKEDNTNMLRRRLAHAAEKAGDVKLSLETWQGLAKEFPNDAVIKNKGLE